jgi:ATP-dependent helicase HrpB
LDDRRPESRIFLAASLTLDEIRETFAAHIITEELVEFDDASAAVVARLRERLGAITLRDASLANPDPERVRIAFMAEVRRRGLSALPWSDAARRFRGSSGASHAMSRAGHRYPTTRSSDTRRVARTRLDGVRKWSELQRVDLAAALATLIEWRQRRALDELAQHISKCRADRGCPWTTRIPMPLRSPREFRRSSA